MAELPTHCRRGHEYTKENSYIDPKGKRSCRECRRITHLRYVKDTFRSLGVSPKVATKSRDGKVTPRKAPASYL